MAPGQPTPGPAGRLTPSRCPSPRSRDPGERETTEDAVEAAVVESTAVAEDGGVRSVEVDDEDRIVWVAPLPDDYELVRRLRRTSPSGVTHRRPGGMPVTAEKDRTTPSAGPGDRMTRGAKSPP